MITLVLAAIGSFCLLAIAGAAAGIARILFYVFLVLLVVSLIMHLARGGRSL